MSDFYDIPTATRRLQRPMDQIKDVMRYSDVQSVHIDKWRSTDPDGKPVTRFSTSIRSSSDEDWYGVEEED